MIGKRTPNRWLFAAVLLLLCFATGCEKARIMGTWKGTFDGEDHELEFTGMGQNSGRLYRSTDLLGEPGWTSWKVTRDRGKKQFIKAGSRKVIITFVNNDKMEVFDEESQNRVEMERVGGSSKDKEEEDSKSYATAYLLLVLAVAFGLVAICRPSRRQQA